MKIVLKLIFCISFAVLIAACGSKTNEASSVGGKSDTGTTEWDSSKWNESNWS